jgi:hypothetical protein
MGYPTRHFIKPGLPHHFRALVKNRTPIGQSRHNDSNGVNTS